ncbi:MAG TPA: hypothetical protein VGK87_06860 [Anaerolineae bacterium]
MNNTLRRILLIAAVIVGGGLLIGIASSVFARSANPFGIGPWNMMGGNNTAKVQTGGMMGGYTGTRPYGSEMMNGGAWGQMMGNNGMMGAYRGTLQNGSGMMSSDAMQQMMNGGMMGFGSPALLGVKPLSVDQATTAVNAYLTSLGNKDLVIAEIMIFDNNAYARITEKSTGAGAFELLVNPATKAVYPEPGPNMMWNTKYSPMRNMMGGATGQATITMPVSASDALKAAQAYLDQNLPGAKTAEDADTFYGYYTIDILRDGKVVGMLGVNGYSSAVFLHTWHGRFIEMSESR